MATVMAQKMFVRSTALLAVLFICGCGWYPPAQAHVTVATVDCSLPGAALTAGAPAPTERSAPAEKAEQGAGEPAETATVELVPAAAPAAEKPATKLRGAEAQPAPEVEMDRHLTSIARLIKATRADIVALQGLRDEEALNSLRGKLSSLGCEKKYCGYAFLGEASGGPSGVAVLSTLPITNFRRPEADPGSDLEHTACVEAHVQLPGHRELMLFNFRLHPERTLQLAEAKAIYDLTLPLRRADVNLMLAGCLNSAEPYRYAPTEAAETADRVISGANTPARADDLVDLHGYLWPKERATGAGGAECCRMLVSPELTADTYRKTDWYLARVKVVSKDAGEGAPRALVARFSLR